MVRTKFKSSRPKSSIVKKNTPKKQHVKAKKTLFKKGYASRGDIIVIPPDRILQDSIPATYTRWDMNEVDGYESILYPGSYVVRLETKDKYKISVLLSSGAPSAKHHYWVKKSFIKEQYVK